MKNCNDNRGTDKDLQCDRCKMWFPDDCDIDVRSSGTIVCDDCITPEEWALDSEVRLTL